MLPHSRLVVRLPLALCLGVTVAAATRAADTSPAPHPATAAPKLIPAPDTTLITSPLLPDGTPDYLTALNNELAQGVTPENNAAIPILRAAGPAHLSADRRTAVLKALALHLPTTGVYYIDLYAYAKEHDAKPDAIAMADDATQKSPWVAKDFPLVADWLKANEVPIAQITAASRLPRLYCPLVSDKKPLTVIDVLVPLHAAPLRHATYALTARAMLRAGSNEPAAARADILTIHRLVRLANQDPFLIGSLVAIAADARAFHADEALLRSQRLPAAEAKGLLADLRSLSEIRPAPTMADRDELFCLLDELLQGVRGHPDELIHSFVWASTSAARPFAHTLDQADWNVVFRAVVRRATAINAASRKPLAAERHEALQAFSREERAAGLPISPNDPSAVSATDEAPEVKAEKTKQYLVELGRFLSRRPDESVPAFSQRVALFFTAMTSADERFAILLDRATATHRLTLVAAALAVYHADHQSYPASLDALHDPAYLPTIPLDPFSGKPLLYRTTPAGGYIFYSVGDNGIDDNAKDRSPGGDDIVIRMP